MHYQIRNFKETNTVELKKTDMDGSVDKTKLNVYEDGTDEEFLKLVKEFQNYVETYKICGNEHATHTIYKKCLAGAARDIWDQINILKVEDGERDDITFQFHMRGLTSKRLVEEQPLNQRKCK